MKISAATQEVVNHVNPEAFKDWKNRLNLPETQQAECFTAARILEYVSEEISYSSDEPNLTRTPCQTLEEEQGNCADQSALLASILKANQFPVCLRTVQNQAKEDHIFVEVGLEGDLQQIERDLKKYYQNHSRVMQVSDTDWKDLNRAVETRDGFHWFICDPTSSFVMGWNGGLQDDGFLNGYDEDGYDFVHSELVEC